MSATKRRRGARTARPKASARRRLTSKRVRTLVRKPVAKVAKKPPAAKPPRTDRASHAATAVAEPPKKPKLIQPHEEAPKDTPASRPAPKPPQPKKPKPPAKTMQVPLPETQPLLQLRMPDVRRAATPKGKLDVVARGQLRPEPPAKPREPGEEGDDTVDATLMMSSLAVDVAPKIEDNYDYSVLDEFRASKFCPSPTRMVNTGCGGGEPAVYFSKLGYKVVGIDSDRTAVGLARERAWLAGQDVDFMVGDLFETPNLLPAESFGLALDRGAFHRLDDDRDRQRYLANIQRLLFRGGVFFLSAGFFPFDDKAAKDRRAPRSGHKLLLAREGGVVVNELRQAGFELLHRTLRKTADSGDYGELILYLKK